MSGCVEGGGCLQISYLDVDNGRGGLVEFENYQGREMLVKYNKCGTGG